MDVRAILKELGLELPVAALPLASYVPAVRTGNLVFTAGQLPLFEGKLVFTGKVGGDVTQAEANKAAEVCLLNAIAAVALVADINKIARVVRVVGYVNSAPGFIAAPAVVNGASDLLLKIWGDVNGKHARSAIGVAELPLNAPVEIELTVELSE